VANLARRTTVIVARGNWGTVECVVRNSGQVPARDFLQNDLEQITEGGKHKPQATARARFMVLFQMMADSGSVPPKRFGKEMGRLFAFKHEVRNIQIRFPCFQDRKCWMLTHGFQKPGAKKKLGAWPKAEIDRAAEIKGEYYQQLQAIRDAAKEENR
jgi:hypothetical protein